MQRKVNLEILRIIAMLMIVSLHFFLNTGALTFFNEINLNFNFTWFMEALSYISVDIFVLITGYFFIEKKFKSSRLINVYITTLFYTLFFLILFSINSTLDLNKIKIYLSILPIISGHYWFVTTYLMLTVLSPIINSAIKYSSKNEHFKIIIVLVTIFSIIPTIAPLTDVNLNLNGGTNIVWFITLYLVGGYFKKYPKKNSLADCIFSLLFIVAIFMSKLIIFMLSKVLLKKVIGSAHFFHHNSLLVFLSACYLFRFFSTLEIKGERFNKFIPFISKCCFGVYLIHENVFMKEKIWNFISEFNLIHSENYIFYSIVTIVSIFILCVSIEALRLIAFRILGLNRIITLLSEKIDQWLKLRL